jgi:eukaryotic-like serine/threonine-protein kinase
MELASGTRLGPYEIIAALGAGGMGEVYRARDTRLDRTVAIKILPSHFSSAELRNRFQREARTLSSISHPNICHLYDVGSQDGVEFLVMELLDGETLSERLLRGPLPPHEVLRIGIEIAEALSKAHRLGIIHRDLKPSNIMLTKQGAKLMDFGLAKPTVDAAAMSNSSSAALATATLQHPTTDVSSAGSVVGTIHYMAPEQVEGKQADARSDIFAFGAVLYEMTTGRRAFEGKSNLSVASAILQVEPPAVSKVQPGSSTSLDYLIRTCLAKDPDDRFQTAHDVKLQMSWLLRQPSEAPAAEASVEPSRSWRFAAISLGILALLAVLVAVLQFVTGRKTSAPAVTKFAITLPGKQELAADSTLSIALSSDGRRMAYVAADSGVPHLYVRRLDQFAAIAIPESEGATFPFFSPNGEWVAFFSQGKLKKASSDGSNPVVVCNLPTFFGGTWVSEDTIAVGVPTLGLATVNANGGDLHKVSLRTTDSIYAVEPIWLPGTDWVVFTDFGSQRNIRAVKLSSGELRTVVQNAQTTAYSMGQLLYYTGGELWAAPFDVRKAAVTGSIRKIASGVDEQNYVSQAAASSNGVLAYAAGLAGNFSRNLFLVTRKGEEQKLDIPSEDYVDPAFSPDGKRIALSVRRATEQQLAVYDRDRGALAMVVPNGEINAAAEWTPDGKNLIFDISGASRKRGIYEAPADGSAPPQLLRETSLSSHVTSVTGNYAVVTVNDPATSMDLWLLSLTGDHDLQVYKKTPATERQGSFSPDGHWLAYASNESGRSEVYVQPAPGPGGRWQISSEGGEQPRWVRNGREIIYRNGTKMMSVAVELQPTFRTSKPVELFDREFDRGGSVPGYDVSPDGQLFVMTRSEHANPNEIRVVIGWPNEGQ